MLYSLFPSAHSIGLTVITIPGAEQCLFDLRDTADQAACLCFVPRGNPVN